MKLGFWTGLLLVLILIVGVVGIKFIQFQRLPKVEKPFVPYFEIFQEKNSNCDNASSEYKSSYIKLINKCVDDAIENINGPTVRTNSAIIFLEQCKSSLIETFCSPSKKFRFHYTKDSVSNFQLCDSAKSDSEKIACQK